jgi:hypothetical protein
METKQCLTCSKEKSLSDFPAQKKRSGLLYYRPHCYSCKYDKEIIAGRIPDKNYHREYYYSNMLDIKYKAYRHRDNSKYKSDSVLSRDDAVMIMMKPCHYCQKEKSNGIDRKDSNLGYTKENAVPCCEKCNNLLSDIPYIAKAELISGLTSINEKGLLDKWTIPTKRKS